MNFSGNTFIVSRYVLNSSNKKIPMINVLTLTKGKGRNFVTLNSNLIHTIIKGSDMFSQRAGGSIP